ncbi:polysaccharide pyruvyl transferase family protein [Leucobacter triazinivorans]|uniref:Polysaccharide pyruvyl transferase family protein n=1 Tax=Leucobacter triazinivorans TaxID=1784719 RepID=A0A4P6KE89_9MICO|nr:polysaccharide pyruvyl transferase family protein [Leucobacter triazinivorans]QBE48647.1 polysaccharide pyruvyl transferase family protein [Leucobacter triazinivorans]
MRAAKNPLQPFSATETIRLNTIGNNSGNLMFAAATHALLAVEGTTIDAIPSFREKDLAARVNEEYDGVIVPLANCFRPAFEPELRNLTRFIQGLKKPFAMMSGGAQVEFNDPEFKGLEVIKPAVAAFCRAVLDKSDKITVRGETTATYIRSLGFNEVEVIGCPSLSRMGREFQIHSGPSQFGSRLAYNVEVSKDLMGGLIERLESAGADLTYVPQDMKSLEMLVWNREVYPLSRDEKQPLHLSHRHMAPGRVKFFLDSSPWIDFMRTQDAALGPRIHGAVAAISAGTPALLIAHDTRTKELARYHGIPHILPSELESIRGLDDLWARLDYTEFNDSRHEQIDRVVNHLESNSFSTTLSKGKEPDRQKYFSELANRRFPQAVSACEESLENEKIAELRRKVISYEARLKNLERTR